MMSVVISSELRAFVRARIDAFAQERPAVLAWLDAAVERFDALPIYIDSSGVLALTPAGVLVEWSTEEDDPTLGEPEPRWARIALAQAARRYPELLPLRPSRTADAVDCPSCGGSGTMKLPAGMPDNLVCRCGGLGFLPAAELRAEPSEMRLAGERLKTPNTSS